MPDFSVGREVWPAQNHGVALNGKVDVVENAVLRLRDDLLRSSWAILKRACWLASELAPWSCDSADGASNTKLKMLPNGPR
jgi:hypothetical protein